MVSTLVYQLAVLFAMIACGWLAVRCRLLKSSDSRVLSIVIIYLLQPCVILRAFQTEPDASVRTGFLFSLAVTLLIHVLLLGAVAILRRVLRLSPVEQASVIYSNAGTLAIPLVSALLGDAYIINATAFMCVQLCFIWTHCDTLLRGERRIRWRNLVRNCNLIAILAGILMMAFRLRLPAFALDVLSDMSAAMAPAGMVMIGMLFAAADIPSLLKNRRLWLV